MNNVFLVVAVIGATQFIKLLYAKNIEGALVILAAVVIGAVAGLAHLDGLTLTNGIVGALAAVGIHTAATQATFNSNTSYKG